MSDLGLGQEGQGHFRCWLGHLRPGSLHSHGAMGATAHTTHMDTTHRPTAVPSPRRFEARMREGGRVQEVAVAGEVRPVRSALRFLAPCSAGMVRYPPKQPFAGP